METSVRRPSYLLKAFEKAFWGMDLAVYFDGEERSSPILQSRRWLIPPRADARECRQLVLIGKS